MHTDTHYVDVVVVKVKQEFIDVIIIIMMMIFKFFTHSLI